MSDRARMRTAILDYGSGNLASAAKAFERAARERVWCWCWCWCSGVEERADGQATYEAEGAWRGLGGESQKEIWYVERKT